MTLSKICKACGNKFTVEDIIESQPWRKKIGMNIANLRDFNRRVYCPKCTKNHDNVISKDNNGFLTWDIPTKIYNVKDGCIEQLIAQLPNEPDVIFSRLPDVDTIKKLNLLKQENEGLKNDLIYKEAEKNASIKNATIDKNNSISFEIDKILDEAIKDGFLFHKDKKYKIDEYLTGLNEWMGEPNTKYCACCKKIKPLNDFYKNNQKKDGYQNYCKDCKNEYSKKIYLKIKSIPKEKICNKCNIIKPINEFYKNKNAKDLHTFRCKSCLNEENKEYYLKKHSKIVTTVEQKKPSEIKISDNSLPLVDSGTVLEDSANTKVMENYRKFPWFKKKVV